MCMMSLFVYLVPIVSYGFELLSVRYRAPEVLLRSSYYTPAIGMPPYFATPYVYRLVYPWIHVRLLDDTSASCLYVWLVNMDRPDDHPYKFTLVIEKAKY